MPSTREQALKAKETNLKRNPNYYVDLGSIGGKTVTENTKNRGFASMTPERRLEVAKKGAKMSAYKRSKNERSITVRSKNN